MYLCIYIYAYTYTCMYTREYAAGNEEMTDSSATRHDLFLRTRWLIHVYAYTRGFRGKRRDVVCIWCVTWLIHLLRDMTHSYVWQHWSQEFTWRDSCMCMHTREYPARNEETIHSSAAWHDSFIGCVTWHILTCNVTHSCVCIYTSIPGKRKDDSFETKTWFVQLLRHTGHGERLHPSTVLGSIQLQVSFVKEPYKRDYILQKKPIHLLCDMTDSSAVWQETRRSAVRHNSFYVWHDSFTCVHIHASMSRETNMSCGSAGHHD